jgi:hypothetical protein
MTLDEQRATGRKAAAGCIQGLAETARQMPYESRAAFWDDVREFVNDVWPRPADKPDAAPISKPNTVEATGESWRLDE